MTMTDAPDNADTVAEPAAPVKADTAALKEPKQEFTQQQKAEAKAEPAEETPPPKPKNWRESLPEELRVNPTLAKFSDIESLAKAHISAVSMIGREKVAVPTDEHSWEMFYKAGGRPETKEGYEFLEVEKVLEEVPEGFKYDKDGEEAFREVAHKAGLNVKQAQTLRDWYLNVDVAQTRAKDAERMATAETTLNELTKEFGNATGKKLAAARDAVEAFAGPDFAKMLDETGLGNDARLVRGFIRLAAMTQGDTKLIGQGAGEQTPAEIQIAIADHAHAHREALFNKSHPEHDLRVKQRQALFEKLHPQKQAS